MASLGHQWTLLGPRGSWRLFLKAECVVWPEPQSLPGIRGQQGLCTGLCPCSLSSLMNPEVFLVFGAAEMEEMGEEMPRAPLENYKGLTASTNQLKLPSWW